MFPTASTFAERREALRVMEQFGEVTMFRSFKVPIALLYYQSQVKLTPTVLQIPSPQRLPPNLHPTHVHNQRPQHLTHPLPPPNLPPTTPFNTKSTNRSHPRAPRPSHPPPSTPTSRKDIRTPHLNHKLRPHKVHNLTQHQPPLRALHPRQAPKFIHIILPRSRHPALHLRARSAGLGDGREK